MYFDDDYVIDYSKVERLDRHSDYIILHFVSGKELKITDNGSEVLFGYKDYLKDKNSVIKSPEL